MNKSDLIKAVKKLSKKEAIPLERIIVGAGGALMMHGLRSSTNDVDVAVDECYFKALLKEDIYRTHTFLDAVVIECDDNVDVHINHYTGGLTIIDGIHCYDLQGLLDQKLKLNRPKDQKDIKALKEKLGLE